ncbi:hypothetical protein Tco_1043811 [Tanacetum coccineum]|uniref:Photosystem II reaction center protein Z n=1 Tax=Tanacetum coccineum TaxID=301880 RepID=A0ABQ5GN48_9ASTR
MSLSSALIATVALLIIVVVVAVVVVVVVIVVVGIYRPASTVFGQMANPIAVIAPSGRLAWCSASYSAVVGFVCSWKDHHTFLFLYA